MTVALFCESKSSVVVVVVVVGLVVFVIEWSCYPGLPTQLKSSMLAL